MNNVAHRLLNSVQRDGVVATVLRIFKYPARVLKRRHFSERVIKLQSAEEKFTWIYKNNHWSSEESASGLGSTLKYTENLRHELPKLLRQFSLRRVFDAPCGDFNWMKSVVDQTAVEYVGGDIVLPLVKALNQKYENPTKRIAFVHIDLTRDEFPSADLMICRDCLFHLSFKDTHSLLDNYVRSGIPYLLTTTHHHGGNFNNFDIQTGGFRMIDLFSAPYHFPREVLASIDDWVEPDPRRQMCLWSREQIVAALSKSVL